MTSDKTARNLDAIEDDVPTAELEVLTEADIVAIEAREQLEAETGSQQIETGEFQALGDDFDEPWPTSRAELGVRAEISTLQSEIEQLRSDAVALGEETKVLRDLRDKLADELQEATRTNAEMTALLRRRDDELAALKSALAAKTPMEEKTAGHDEVAAEEMPPCVPPQRAFDSGETRTLVKHDEHGSHEFALRPGRMSLGSAVDNDIRISDGFVSRHHAQILSSSRETVLRDMSSTNGTYVNSRKINKCALQDGDSITIGKVSFTFVRKTAPDVRPAAHAPAPEPGARSGRGAWR